MLLHFDNHFNVRTFALVSLNSSVASFIRQRLRKYKLRTALARQTVSTPIQSEEFLH